MRSRSLVRSTSRPSVAGTHGTQVAALLAGGSAAACYVMGTYAQVRLVYPVAAVVIAVHYATRNKAALVEFVLWLWFLTPAVRRFVDLGIGFDPRSPVMLAPALASLVVLPAVIRGRRPMNPAVQHAFTLGLFATLFALGLGFIRSGIQAPVAGGLDWIAPIAVGAFIAVDGPDEPQLVASFQRVFVWGLLFLGTYSIIQYFVLPSWDRAWMLGADLVSIGQPEPQQFRTFSTLNSQQPFGQVIGAALIIALASRHRLRTPALLVGLASLGLSLVRAAWFGLAVAVAALGLLGRGRNRARIFGSLGITAAALVLIGGVAAEQVTTRVETTVSRGREDVSFSQRWGFHEALVPEALARVHGTGLGSTGTSSSLKEDEEQGDIEHFDGGALEILYVVGGPVGLLYLLAAGIAVVAVVRRSAGTDAFRLACTAAVLGLFAQLAFANTLIGAGGVVFWALLGFLGREPTPA